ncbi:protein NdvB, partial [mine drainage metagenome]
GMLNPVQHARSAADIERYKVEPYVMTADVYAAPAHVGRGGWSWYTGSAGWMYRLIVESLLGLRREGARLRIVPVMPADWHFFELDYRYRGTRYHITVLQAGAGDSDELRLDGVIQESSSIVLHDDGLEHRVEIRQRRAI